MMCAPMAWPWKRRCRVCHSKSPHPKIEGDTAMKLSELFANMANNKALSDVDIDAFDQSNTPPATPPATQPETPPSDTDNLQKIMEDNQKLSARIKELELSNQKLLNSQSIQDNEKTVEEHIYDLCVPNHKKDEVFKL